MVKELNRYLFGDMKAVYYIDEDKRVELMLIPSDRKEMNFGDKNQSIDSLVQIKIMGDTYPGGYAGGNTLRQGPSTTELIYQKQECLSLEDTTRVMTTLLDHRGYEIIHYLEYRKGQQSFWSYSSFENKSEKEAMLEMISSFSLGGITPFVKGDANDSLKLYRLRSVWSMEGRVEEHTLEELQLEPSWAGHAIRCERFGQAGSMPVNHYFPYMVLEDTKNAVYWGAELAHNASWQMEVYRKDEGVAMSGGLADREFGHWMKRIGPGERFETPHAILTVCHGKCLEEISQRMTRALEPIVEQGPASEQELPILFNEYCTTWGSPSHDNITQILEAIKGHNFSYFVIDCGWYREEGIPWDIAMGDYQVSKELFPQGLQKTVDAIKHAGMKPGIWFEIDNVGEKARAYQYIDHLLTRDGYPLTTTMRRFWNMRDPWVETYLTEKVIGTLKTYGFEYLKMDYNDTIGIGCDGAESIGEGLCQNMKASYQFIEKIKREIPGIILENCASGGHHLEPKMMGICSMASFSDAHECEEIPVIAANLHMVILPRQSQIWAVIRKTDSIKRIAYSIANTFLGRCCVSGDVMDLSKEQWQILDRGLSFYKRIAPIIKEGETRLFGTKNLCYRHLKGWQAVFREGRNQEAFVVIHTFHDKLPGEISIPLSGDYQITEIYADAEVKVALEQNNLIYYPEENMRAIAVYLSKNMRKKVEI